MKILYTLNSANPGGMEQHVLDLVSQLSSRGHAVYVWCPDGPLSTRFEDLGAQVVNISIRNDLDFGYILALSRFLRKEKIDVLHAHEPKAVINSLIAGVFSHTKVRVTHTHTPISEWQINPAKKAFDVFVNSFFVNIFSTVEIALTESRKKVKQAEGIFGGKLKVFPNGVDVSRFSVSDVIRQKYRQEVLGRHNISTNSFVFGNIGRITREKGHFVFLEGFSKFLQMAHVDKDNVSLLIVGGGALEAELKEEVSNLGLDEKVLITGRFSEEDKVKYYSALDCFVFPSLAEGFGIVLLEAMANGLPILCSDLEVLQEVGDGTVLFFEKGNSVDLSEMLMSVYQRKDTINRIGNAALERVRSLYTIEKFGGNYESFYKELLERK